MENNTIMTRVGVTEIIGKEISFYNTWEEPLFLAKDVAIWLDHSDTSTMVRKLDEDEKVTNIVCTLGGNQEMLFLTEDGIYEVLMLSRKPDAKPLKKKIKLYLKNIRKTGGAVEDGREEDFIKNHFPSFSDEVQISMVQDLIKKNKELKKLKPKADYCDKVLNPINKDTFTKLITASDVAKDLGMSGIKFNKVLHNAKVIYKQSKSWKLYSKYEDMIPEYFDYHISEYSQSLKYTEKGRKYVIEHIEEWKENYTRTLNK